MTKTCLMQGLRERWRSDFVGFRSGRVNTVEGPIKRQAITCGFLLSERLRREGSGRISRYGKFDDMRWTTKESV